MVPRKRTYPRGYGEQWNVMDQRFLPAQELFGMAIDRYETVHLALR